MKTGRLMPHAPRKQGRQHRAQVTQAAIVEAAARILEDGGHEGTTTNHIAERAGVSIGSLYQYFPNKQAVIAALLRREREDLLGSFEVLASSDGDPRQIGNALIDVALAHQFQRPKLALELEYLEAILAVDEVQELAMRLSEQVIGLVRRIRPGADLCVARDIVAICKAMTNAAALSGETDQDALRKRLRKAVFGYLE